MILCKSVSMKPITMYTSSKLSLRNGGTKSSRATTYNTESISSYSSQTSRNRRFNLGFLVVQPTFCFLFRSPLTPLKHCGFFRKTIRFIFRSQHFQIEQGNDLQQPNIRHMREGGGGGDETMLESERQL